MDTMSARPASLSECSFSRHSSKIRAPCGNPACEDLCGGYRATDIPTATRTDLIFSQSRDVIEMCQFTSNSRNKLNVLTATN